MNRSELKNAAKFQLKGKWGTAVLATIVSFIVSGALNSISASIGTLTSTTDGGAFSGILLTCTLVALSIVSAGITLGVLQFFLKLAKSEDAVIGNIFGCMKYSFKAVGLAIMIGIFIFLWSLLLIIPGIIASYRYSQAMLILAENPEISIMDAIRKSKQLMVGHKMEFFILELSFIGWLILAGLTFGIGMLWLLPYMYVTFSNFYLGLDK